MDSKIFLKKVWDLEIGWVGGIAGGAFTGKAAEGSAVEIGEDLSDVVAELSVRETQLLDMLGDSGLVATNQEHEWLQDALNAHIATLGANVASSAAAGFALPVATTTQFKVGMVVEDALDGKVVHEQMLVQSIFGANTLIVDRAQAGTSATSHVSNNILDIVASAAKEGDTPSDDISTNRPKLGNFTQIYERNVLVSGTKNAVNNVGVGSEVDHQVNQRLAELLRELELSTIRGRKLKTTIAADERRTSAGFVASITQIRSLGALVSSGLDDLLQDTWTQGARADLIIIGADLKRTVNLFPGTQVRQNQADRAFIRQVNIYEGFKDTQAIMQNRYMDARAVAVGQSDQIRVLPLQGRSFFVDTLGKTGDRTQSQVIGEYTNEFGNDKAWALGAPVTP